MHFHWDNSSVNNATISLIDDDFEIDEENLIINPGAGRILPFKIKEGDVDGKIYANDADDDWVKVSDDTFSAGTWYGIAVHLDYAADKWDIYITSGLPGSALAKLNSTPLDMNAHASAIGDLTTVEITGGCSLDNVVASLGTTTVVDDQLEAVVVRDETDGGASEPATDVWILGVVPDHRYDGGSLLGQLGKEIAVGMNNGDQIRFWIDGRLQEYTRSAGGVWALADEGDLAANAIFPLPGQVMWRYYQANSPNQYSFYSTDFDPSLAAAATFDPPPLEVFGGDGGGVNHGWTAQRWTTASKTLTGANLTPAICGIGARVFVIPDGGHIVRWSQTLNGTSWLNEETFNKGDLIWIEKVTSGDVPWTP